MLEAIGVPSLDALIDQTIPPDIRSRAPLDLPEGETEYAYLRRLRGIAARNTVARSYIGMGYYGCITPSVILRNVFENPGWYTPYTPVSGRDCAGPSRIAAEFSNGGQGSDRDGHRDGVAPRRGHGSGRGDGDVPPAAVEEDRDGAGERVSRRQGLLSADARRAARPRRAARHQARDRRRVAAVRRGAVARVRAPAPVSGRSRRDCRSQAGDRARAGEWRPGRRGHGSHGADAHHAARRDGSRCGGRQLAAVRRAARLRRAARGVSGHARILRAAGARANHRALDRCPWPPGLPHGAPDARAAHPPREGDVEYLHGAGAPRQHRGDVRGLSRSSWPPRDCLADS